MRVLLLSTYELGHQPHHVASPAGALLAAGHEVRCLDLSVEPFDREQVRWAEAVACSVPMHTALRLALGACAGVRRLRPDVPICLYGLYAHLGAVPDGPHLADRVIAGEYEPALVAWVSGLAREGGSPRAGVGPAVTVSLGRTSFVLPARHLLPPLDRYARLSVGGEERLAGYVEASHGCAHRCRHCPVPVVYDGRTRLVGLDVLLADVAQLVELGARHLTFGDPDFLNGPHHARRVVDAVHGAFGDLTFDVTAKVEHVLAHADLWPALARAGCLFVVSAFESANDGILAHLAKGHTAADEVEAVRVLRRVGIEPRPSLLPFTPWTTPADVVDLFDLVARCDLVGNVDVVQLAIRLLVPDGSLLAGPGPLAGRLGPYDAEHLGWTWVAGDPRLDELQLDLAALAERTAAEGWPATEAFAAARGRALTMLGIDPAARPEPPPADDLRSAVPADLRPRLTEPWFCCAEPTGDQFAAVVDRA
jgi:hypothetical protein